MCIPGTGVFGSIGSVKDGYFVRNSRQSVTLDFLNGNFRFGNRRNVFHSLKSGISESGTSENLCIIVDERIKLPPTFFSHVHCFAPV